MKRYRKVVEVARHAADDIARMADVDELRALWKAHPDLRALIESRINEIKGAESGGSDRV